MMAVDLSSLPWLRGHMDEIDANLLKLIYTRVGMIMEDTSIIALELGGPEPAFAADKIVQLAKASEAIAALISAANTLH